MKLPGRRSGTSFFNFICLRDRALAEVAGLEHKEKMDADMVTKPIVRISTIPSIPHIPS